MCVIAIVDETDERPSEIQIRAMFEQNSAGAGAAWREDGLVKWEKGLDLAAIQELNISLPQPYILHFRIPSCGGNSKALTHPFLIHEEAPCELTGETDGAVLFHNGHWGGYEREFKDALYKGRLVVPENPWSDTRVMAFLAGHFGLGYLEWIEDAQKLVVLTPTEIKMFGNGWTYHEKKFLVSNTFWNWRTEPPKPPTVYHRPTHQQVIDVKNERPVANIYNPLGGSRNLLIERGVLPADGEDTKVTKAAQDAIDSKRATSDSEVKLLTSVAGGTPLDELSFRGDRVPETTTGDLQISLEEVEAIVRQTTGDSEATVVALGEGIQGNDGGTRTVTIHTLSEQDRWARSICQLRNPKGWVKGIFGQDDSAGERERRRKLLRDGITHMGGL